MPVARHRLAGDDGNRCGAQFRIQRLLQAESRDRLGDVDVDAHGEGMDAGICPPGGMEGNGFPGDRQHRLLHRLLHRGAVRLALKAHERPAIDTPSVIAKRVTRQPLSSPDDGSCLGRNRKASQQERVEFPSPV